MIKAAVLAIIFPYLPLSSSFSLPNLVEAFKPLENRAFFVLVRLL
jgi:hypothetical protein